jgi:hypothetical protein
LKKSFKFIYLAIVLAIGISIASVVIMSDGSGVVKPSIQDASSYFGGPEIPSQFRSAIMVGDSGFVDKKTLLPDARPPVNDFILRPGTTGHITIQYNFTDDTNDPGSDFKIKDVVGNYVDGFNSKSNIIRVVSGNLIDSPNDSIGVRIYITPSDVNYLGHNAVQVTYTIEAGPSAEGGTYVLETYASQARFGQFITVGSEHYDDRMP